ncbi:MAG: M23 family metallopeptidase [Methylacidiphilales bacterium]|nr:M23 family metallopeptidase [Candidatus Methylacidiphilales bacterium]
MRWVVFLVIPWICLATIFTYAILILGSSVVSSSVYFLGMRTPPIMNKAAPFFGVTYHEVGDAMKQWVLDGRHPAVTAGGNDDNYDPLADENMLYFLPNGNVGYRPIPGARPLPNRKRWFESPIDPNAAVQGGLVRFPINQAYVRITSKYGDRRTDTDFHNGIDISMYSGTPLRPFAGGLSQVVAVGYMEGGYGHYVVLSHGSGNDRVLTLYAHLSSVHVQPGQVIGENDTIGLSGNTGNSTGPHLHFEVIRMGENGIPVNISPCELPSFAESAPEGAC